MRLFTRIIVLILFAYLALIFVANRALFLSTFDEVYWKDKYEHSQWKLPLSQRTLGDDGLYLYEGYRLVHGADPTLLNAEVPPFGKYLIGASVLLFHNGHIYGMVVYGAVLLLFFLLARTLIPPSIAVVLTALFALDPLLTSQATLTMLDGLQLVFLLLFFLLLKRKAHPAILGAALGLFAETKFGILAPILIILGITSLRTTRRILLFLAAAAIAYLLPYARYFMLGYSAIDWLQIQKWIVSFYTHGKLTPTYGSAGAAILIGYAQNIYSRAWLVVREWSPVWPILALATLITVRKNWRPAMIFTAVLFMFYLIIPFWTRYLLLLLPFLYLGLGLFLHNLPRRTALYIIIPLLAINAFSAIRVLLPTPETAVRQFTYEWQHGFFQDMYENLTNNTKRQTTREEFRRTGLTAYHDAQIESVEISISKNGWSHLKTRQDIPFTVIYHTRNLGEFKEEGVFPVVREDGRWRVAWSWDFLLKDFTPERKLVTDIIPARRGSIVGGDKKAISYDFPSWMIEVVPREVDPHKEQEMLSLIENLFKKNITAVAFHQRYVGNTLPDLPIPLAIVGAPLTDERRGELLSFPGVHLTAAPGRVQGTSALTNVGFVVNTNFGECCSSLYSTTTYDGFEGIEKEYNATLKGHHGGTLVIAEADGTPIRTIVIREKKDGADVDLLSTFYTP